MRSQLDCTQACYNRVIATIDRGSGHAMKRAVSRVSIAVLRVVQQVQGNKRPSFFLVQTLRSLLPVLGVSISPAERDSQYVRVT